MKDLKRQEAVNLEGATGFTLQMFDAKGDVIDSVGTYATDNAARPLEEVILLSAARTLAYMFWFSKGKRRNKKAYSAHVRDFIRKANDYLKVLEERW